VKFFLIVLSLAFGKFFLRGIFEEVLDVRLSLVLPKKIRLVEVEIYGGGAESCCLANFWRVESKKFLSESGRALLPDDS
jgi:hypothetical protein